MPGPSWSTRSALAGRIGEHDDEAAAYVELSDLARREGDLAAAGRLLASALEIVEPRAAQRPACRRAAAAVTAASGCLAEQQGDLARRGGLARAGPGRADRAGADADDPEPALAGGGRGRSRRWPPRARGERGRGRPRLLGLAATLRGYSNDFSLEVARTRSALAEALSEEDLAAAYARGRAQGRDEALALVP